MELPAGGGRAAGHLHPQPGVRQQADRGRGLHHQRAGHRQPRGRIGRVLHRARDHPHRIEDGDRRRAGRSHQRGELRFRRFADPAAIRAERARGALRGSRRGQCGSVERGAAGAGDPRRPGAASDQPGEALGGFRDRGGSLVPGAGPGRGQYLRRRAQGHSDRRPGGRDRAILGQPVAQRSPGNRQRSQPQLFRQRDRRPEVLYRLLGRSQAAPLLCQPHRRELQPRGRDQRPRRQYRPHARGDPHRQGRRETSAHQHQQPAAARIRAADRDRQGEHQRRLRAGLLPHLHRRDRRGASDRREYRATEHEIRLGTVRYRYIRLRSGGRGQRPFHPGGRGDRFLGQRYAQGAGGKGGRGRGADSGAGGHLALGLGPAGRARLPDPIRRGRLHRRGGAPALRTALYLASGHGERRGPRSDRREPGRRIAALGRLASHHCLYLSRGRYAPGNPLGKGQALSGAHRGRPLAGLAAAPGGRGRRQLPASRLRRRVQRPLPRHHLSHLRLGLRLPGLHADRDGGGLGSGSRSRLGGGSGHQPSRDHPRGAGRGRAARRCLCQGYLHRFRQPVRGEQLYRRRQEP